VTIEVIKCRFEEKVVLIALEVFSKHFSRAYENCKNCV
jgi:hypothetical protein